MRLLIIFVAIFAQCFVQCAALASPSFQGLGFLPGTNRCDANCMSADGKVIAGGCNFGNGGFEAYRWTAAQGIVGLGDLAGGASDSFILSMNADGSVLMGHGTIGTVRNVPFFWTAAGGLATTTCPRVGGISSDGTYVAAGDVRWSAAKSQPLVKNIFGAPNGGADPLPGNPGIAASLINGDGNVLIGVTTTTPQTAFRWTALPTPVMAYLPLVDSDPTYNSYAHALSRDGNVAVGWNAYHYNGVYPSIQAVRWSGGNQVISLGVPSAYTGSDALATNADGSVIVGELQYEEGVFATSFIWDAANGMRPFEPYLTSFGIDLTGWSQLHATLLSDDGQTIGGWAMHNGNREPFVAVVPEPSVFAWPAILLVAVATRRRPSQL